MNTQELISAFADGQLEGDELERALGALAHDPQALQAWHECHLIGDLLRSPDLAGRAAGIGFVDRVSERLAAERFAPVATPAPVHSMPPPMLAPSSREDIGRTRDAASNDPVFRWKLVAGFASLAAAFSVGWALLGAAPELAPPGPQLATAPPPAGMTMIRDPQLDELLAAHQQLGGTAALQMPASFVRQATFDNTPLR
ncbi:sigma-E factor negative regulatory protein [Ramlibacter sp. AN1015]|uniref:sigma-E factor negative regulatory protein n=1 Tax=Ramlibacter sp. AN1015 TaxID=3133428 RepID=UPI0030C4870E